MTPRQFLVFRCSTVIIAALAGSNAYAIDVEKHAIKKNEPALLIAKEVHYDEKNSIATAVGDVEIMQGDTILRADHIVYDVNKDLVTAEGHVSILQPTGDVFFADHANLTTKMQQGVVHDFRARLKDNSLFAAQQGNKVSKDVTHMKKLVYSPCKVCKDTADAKGTAPLWQIQAREGTIDEQAKRVSYRDAFFDVYGVPMLYTPYFSHATPDAPSQSGFLTPQYFHATDLGNVIKTPVYISLAPNMDATLTPWYLSGEKPLLAGEFRSLFEHGRLGVTGAITDTYNRDTAGNVIPGTQVRGYIEAHGVYQLDPYWKVGLDAERATDDTFLQLYRFGWRDVLNSRLYAERIQDRDYSSVEGLAFQGLTTQDNGALSPIVGKATYHHETDPGWAHSRFTVDGNLLDTDRDQGVSTRRVSTTGGWKIPYITPGGQIFEANGTLRGDIYDVTDQPLNSAASKTFSGTTGRVIPQIDLNWRYPFIDKFGEGKSLMVAPVVEFTASPRSSWTNKFPDEDSQVAELSDVNLFSPNRFTGIDQVETGARLTYGTRGHYQNADDEWLEWLLGQTYQENDQNAFPITSAADPHFSDYIGRLGVKYHWFDIGYSFRLDRDNLTPISNNLNTSFLMDPVAFDISYVALRNDPIFGNRQEVFGNANWDVTKTWRFGINGRRDLGSNDQAIVRSAFVPVINPLLQPTPGTVGLGSTLTYHNECIMLTASVGRNYISQQDVRPSTTFGLMLVLNNFESKKSPAASPNVSGAGNQGAVETTAGVTTSTNSIDSTGSLYPTGATNTGQ